MKKTISYFFEEYNFSSQTQRFKQLVYLFLAIKIIYWLLHYNLFFGANAIGYIKPNNLGIIKNIPFLLYNNHSSNIGYFFIFGASIFLILSYFIKKIPFLFEFVLWLLILNIQNKIYPTLTGGDYLLNQFLFFNCFFAKTYRNNLSWQNSLQKCFHNFGVLAVIIQIQLVYVIAGLSKLNNADWLNGTAIQSVSKIKHFNLFSSSVTTTSFLDYILNYLVLLYQLLFPLLIWINKIKKPLIILGVFMHLYIAFGIGLVSFGFIMIISYIYFWPIKRTLI